MEKQVLHRISKSDEELLYYEYNQQVAIKDTDTRRQIESKEKRRSRMAAFSQEYALANTPERAKRLCYETIEDFLDAAEFTYRDLFEICAGTPGVRRELFWPTEQAERFSRKVDELTDEKKALVLEHVLRICPERMIRLTQDKTLSPSERLYTSSFWRSYSKEDNFAKAQELQYVDNYKRRARKYSYNSTEIGRMPDLSETFGVSLHWLYGLDSSCPVLARSGKTEEIMDYFCLLSEPWQTILADGLEAADI